MTIKDKEVLAMCDSILAYDWMKAVWPVATELKRRMTEPSERTLPKEPSLGLLMSMAIRTDHGLGVPGCYDQFEAGSHRRRLDVALADMKKVYEEIIGQGFYKPERESEYAALAAYEEGK